MIAIGARERERERERESGEASGIKQCSWILLKRGRKDKGEKRWKYQVESNGLNV